MRTYGKRKYRDSWCATCKRDYLRAYRAANPRDAAEWRNRSLLRRYGLTEIDYVALLQQQGGVCAICRQPPAVVTGQRYANRYGRLHVDHDHETGRVRGLLCGNCNRGIGMLKHDPALLRNAIVWLEDNTSAPALLKAPTSPGVNPVPEPEGAQLEKPGN